MLVAVSIPIFTSQLAKARNATNAANIRSAKAAAVAAYLSNDESGTKNYEYICQTGVIEAKDGAATDYNPTTKKVASKIKVTITAATDSKDGYEITTDPALSTFVDDNGAKKTDPTA